MKFQELYPSKYVEAADLKGADRTLVITGIRLEELDGMKGKQWKAIITLGGAKKELIANRTCGEALKLMFGSETDAWLGKRITIYPTETEVGGETVPCIRVRGSPDIDRAMNAEIKRGKKTLKIKVIDGTVTKSYPYEISFHMNDEP